MKKLFANIILIATLLFAFNQAKAQGLFLGNEAILMTGPILHYNIGENSKGLSLGWESSIWMFDPNLNSDYPPIGVDAGIEYEFKTGKLRLYTEAEAGLFLIGAAAGPVFEFAKNKPAAVGFQASGWAAFFLGVNLRYRYIDESVFAPGAFFKFPIPLTE